MKVYISPSTQEHNITALKDTEENVMHMIADVVVPMLQDCGLEVFRGRKEQTMQQMVAESNSLNVDRHIAIHSNAMGGADTGKVRGAEVLIYKDSIPGRKLAEAIYKELEVLTPIKDRGIKETISLYETRETDAPAVIIEIDFHDNFDGALWIVNNIKPIAEGISKGICADLGVPFKVNQYKYAIEQIKTIIEALK